MAARRAAPPAPPALTDGDVDLLRQRLAAGDAPRVVIRAASAAVPAGTRGTVVRFGDPASEDEYVVVRIKSDEVPFSPSELSLPGAKAQPAQAVSQAKRPSTSARSAASGKSSSSRATSATGTTGAPRSASAPGRRSGGATGAAPAAATQPAAAARPTTSRRSSRRAARRKPAAALTVTLRFDGDGWSAEASRGARRLSRPAPLRPGAVGALAEHVDDESLRTALVDTVEACRAVVEERAARLRAELQDAEATLRDYETKPKRR